MRLLVLLLILALPLPAHAEKCLTYRARVNVTGVLARKTFPGPPNFESLAKGDERDVYFTLRPVHALCVGTLSNDLDEIDAAVRDVKLVQLILEDNNFELLRPLLGKRVTLSGSLIGAMSGWHHTPVLLSDVKLMPQPDRK